MLITLIQLLCIFWISILCSEKYKIMYVYIWRKKSEAVKCYKKFSYSTESIVKSVLAPLGLPDCILLVEESVRNRMLMSGNKRSSQAPLSHALLVCIKTEQEWKLKVYYRHLGWEGDFCYSNLSSPMFFCWCVSLNVSLLSSLRPRPRIQWISIPWFKKCLDSLIKRNG